MYRFINPEGKTVRIKNLAKFCRERNLDYKIMQRISYGQRHYHKGWWGVSKRTRKLRKDSTKIVINAITGEVYTLTYNNQASFAREHGLAPNYFGLLMNKKRIRYKDWMLKETYDLMYA